MRRPNPGRTLATAGARLRRAPRAALAGLRGAGAAIGRGAARIAAPVGGLLAGAGRAVARLFGAIGSGVAGFWRALSVAARRRLLAALGAAAAVALFLVFAVPNLPCQFPGGDRCPPPDDAEELIPADALAYLHANVDPETEQAELAADVVRRTPVLGGQVAARALAFVSGPGGTPDFERELGPWLGGELAVAVLAGAGARAERVELLEIGDPEGAADYAAALAGGAAATEEHRGLELRPARRDTVSAVVEDFLVIGPPDAVRAVIDTATGAEGAAALAGEQPASELRDELPDHRLAEAYLSEDGIARLLVGARGGLDSLTPLVAPGASRGAAAALSATGEGFELALRSALDPERAESDPGFFAAFPPFEPALPERLASGTLGYLGIGEPRETVRALLAQASAQAPGIAAGFEGLLADLSREGALEAEDELFEALGDEAAFALEPRAADETRAALPYLEFVAAGVDEEAARRALASLQGPLAEAVNTGRGGQAPVFGERRVAGVEARTLRVSPAVELTLAVFDGLAAIATDPAGIAQLAEGDGGLEESALYERATDDLEDEVSLLAYLDLAALVDVGERLGLAEDPLYATFAGEFRRLEALALAVATDEELLATDARLLIGEAEPVAPDPGPLVPPPD